MPERLLRLTEVQRRVPYSRSSIYLKVSRGEFPPPIELGARAVAWVESDIDQWIESRIAKGHAVAPVTPARPQPRTTPPPSPPGPTPRALPIPPQSAASPSMVILADAVGYGQRCG